MSLRRKGYAAATVLALGAATLIGVQGSAAAADQLSLSNFELRPNKMGTELIDRAKKLDKELPNVGVGKVMADANRDGTVGSAGEPCNAGTKGATLGSVYTSICFNSGDNATTDWFPQGVTTVADAQDDKHWGDENQPVLVSWYDHNKGSTEKGVRVSFVDPHTGTYRHVLLVYPTINSYGNPSYMSVRDKQTSDGGSLHAGGMVWYGNFLYVADTNRGFRVFDMRHIYDLGAASNGTTKDKAKVGRHDGVYYGHGYRYVMPQVASWTRTAEQGKTDEGKSKYCTGNYPALRTSYASLDRSGTDHMVAGEYCTAGDPVNGRVAAWPIAGSLTKVDGRYEPITDTGYRWHADAAHKLPSSNIQGATRFNGRWYLSQSAGDNNGSLMQTDKTSASTGTLKVATTQPAAVGPEDLSHWENGRGGTTLGTMWTVSEHENKRMIYATVPEQIAG